MMEYSKVIEIDKLSWSFSKTNPFIFIDGVIPKSHTSLSEDVDPYPCVMHNKSVVSDCVYEVERLFKIGAIVRYVLIPYELLCRTNALANHQFIYVEGNNNYHEEIGFDGKVILSGKRTMIHPVMTKYLVAHEYGHMVDYWITHKMRLEDEAGNIMADSEKFRKMYAKMRGLDYNKHSGNDGNGYLLSIGEVIANDFRIVVCGIDSYVWPHTGIKSPMSDFSKISDFWMNMKERYSIKLNDNERNIIGI